MVVDRVLLATFLVVVRLQNLPQTLLELLQTREQLLMMQSHKSLLWLLHHQQMLTRWFQLASRERMETTITELMAKILATSSQIGLRQKSMLPQVVDLPWVTYLEAMATNHLPFQR